MHWMIVWESHSKDQESNQPFLMKNGALQSWDCWLSSHVASSWVVRTGHEGQNHDIKVGGDERLKYCYSKLFNSVHDSAYHDVCSLSWYVAMKTSDCNGLCWLCCYTILSTVGGVRDCPSGRVWMYASFKLCSVVIHAGCSPCRPLCYTNVCQLFHESDVQLCHLHCHSRTWTGFSCLCLSLTAV